MTTARRWVFAGGAAFALIALFVSGCGEPKRELVPVPTSDAADLEPSVRTALARARAEFDRVANNKPTTAELADAYGELAMTYHAQSIVPPAEAAYSNARALAPRDKRWPYLLGHLYNDSSRVADAIVALEAALALDSRDAPTLYSLGEVYLQHGDFDKAQTMYLQLESDADMRPAALTGLGKVALAKHEYKEAVRYLEEALKLSPGSTRLRQPLAMAYRGLGDRVNAEQNLRQYAASGTEPGVVDPLADALGAKVAASRSLLRRGQRFGNAGRFDLAEPAFRAAVQADPSNAEAIANLGISLANLGRIDEAQQRLIESLALDDTSVFAHLSLGVILDRQGLDQRAITQYSAALSRDPTNLQALVYLADVKMRLGSVEDAIKLYRKAADQMPDSSRMQLSLAMANIRAGHYGDARKVLEAVLKAQPANPEIINALARLLATAPEGALRDGTRALALAKPLFESTKNPDIGQTYAMALAETGDFDHAALLQRETIIVFEHTGRAAEKPFLQRNLARYEQHKATREGWAADDPVFQPRSPAARLAKSP
jgi:tetratricopeptide (TPR) repeat protein